MKELKQERMLGQRCRCRTSSYLNNIIEQDHRAIKRRINAKQGFYFNSRQTGATAGRNQMEVK